MQIEHIILSLILFSMVPLKFSHYFDINLDIYCKVSNYTLLLILPVSNFIKACGDNYYFISPVFYFLTLICNFYQNKMKFTTLLSFLLLPLLKKKITCTNFKLTQITPHMTIEYLHHWSLGLYKLSSLSPQKWM